MKINITYKTPDAIYYALERLHPDDRDRAMKVALEVFGSVEHVDVELDIDTKEVKINKRNF